MKTSDQQIAAALAYFDGQNSSDSNAVTALFASDAEVYNVNLPKVAGLAGVKSFCENLYARTSKREFRVCTVATAPDVVMTHWQALLTFRPGAQIGPFRLAKGFEVTLQGVNKFDFDPGTALIRGLRIYHETTTVGTLAKENSEA